MIVLRVATTITMLAFGLAVGGWLGSLNGPTTSRGGGASRSGRVSPTRAGCVTRPWYPGTPRSRPTPSVLVGAGVAGAISRWVGRAGRPLAGQPAEVSATTDRPATVSER
jgi:hypothetical protein